MNICHVISIYVSGCSLIQCWAAAKAQSDRRPLAVSSKRCEQCHGLGFRELNTLSLCDRRRNVNIVSTLRYHLPLTERNATAQLSLARLILKVNLELGHDVN